MLEGYSPLLEDMRDSFMVDISKQPFLIAGYAVWTLDATQFCQKYDA